MNCLNCPRADIVTLVGAYTNFRFLSCPHQYVQISESTRYVEGAGRCSSSPLPIHNPELLAPQMDDKEKDFTANCVTLFEFGHTEEYIAQQLTCSVDTVKKVIHDYKKSHGNYIKLPGCHRQKPGPKKK